MDLRLYYQLNIALLFMSAVLVYVQPLSSKDIASEEARYTFNKVKDDCSICKCNGLAANCSARNISTLPKDLPRNITSLILKDNNIKHLPDGLLGQLYGNLKKLDVDNNKIVIFGQYTFEGLQNLEYLKIGSNPFKPHLFHPLVYKPLRNIRTIHVSRYGDEPKLTGHINSRIALLDALEGLENSTIESIIYEHITTFPFLLERRYMKFFESCSLKRFILPDNRIFAAETGFSTYMPSLELIDLSRNELQSADTGPDVLLEAYVMMHLKVIKIENNWYRNLHNLTVTIPDEMSKRELALPEGLEELYLSSTFVNIAPRILPFGLKFQRNNKIKILEASASYSIQNIGGPIKGLVNLERFIYSNNDCVISAEFFTCETGFFESLQVLDLAYNRAHLSAINSSAQLFKNCSLLKHIDVSNNNIRDIDADAFVDTTGLEVLNLSGNKINSIITLAELKSLTLLNLSNNDISTIEERTKHEIDELIKTSSKSLTIDIRHNPLICNCDSFRFINWIQSRSDYMYGWRDLTCIYINGSRVLIDDIRLLEMKWNCWKGTIIPSITSFGVVVLGIIFAICIYRNRFKIQYLALHIRALLRRNQQNDINFDFDGFLSYSSLDKNWALKNIFGALACEYNYNICMDERNFMPGSYIADAIIESISKSYKIILIISQNFLRSGWCTYEMNLAQGELATRGRDCLILILKEPVDVIPPELITPTLRSLLETRVYLEWSENEDRKLLFWRKMQDALGDPRYHGEEDTPYLCQANDGDNGVLQRLIQ